MSGLHAVSPLWAADISVQDRMSVQVCPLVLEDIVVPEQYQRIYEGVDKFDRPYTADFADEYRRGFLYGWKEFLEWFQQGVFDLDETTDPRRYPDGVGSHVSPLGPSAFRPGQLGGADACREALLALARERNLTFLPVRTPWAKKLMALGAGDPKQNDAGNPTYIFWAYSSEIMRLTDEDLELLHEVSLDEVKLLHLPHTAITDAGFARLPPMPLLAELCLSGKNLTGASFGTLERFPRLTKVKMTGFRDVKAEDFAAVGKLSELKSLDITAVEIGDDAIPVFLALPKLAHLHLSWAYDGSFGAKLSSQAIARLSGCSQLKSLSLSGCAVDDAAMREIASKLHELWALSLAKTPVTDDSIDCIQKLSNLGWLHLSDTRVTDAGIAHLASHPSLEKLLLNETQITDQSLVTLATLPRIKEICVREGQLSAASITAFKVKKPNAHVIQFRK